MWRATFSGPRLSLITAESPDQAFSIAYSTDYGMVKFMSKRDGFGHGAVCWEPENSDDTLVEITTQEQKIAFALGCMDHMIQVSEDM